jgi:hypothetical protein
MSSSQHVPDPQPRTLGPDEYDPTLYRVEPSRSGSAGAGRCPVTRCPSPSPTSPPGYSPTPAPVAAARPPPGSSRPNATVGSRLT